ncbi:hypothetical protein FRB96_004119 [Tulasnella sp. 330]|nr:hypothetical protein FRB96_004119 [Tulasnella sp. 330]
MPPPGLVAPIFAEGNEPLPPGWTEEDRQQALTARKWEKFASSGMESCAAKSVMSGVVGLAAGAVLSLMGTTFSYEAAYGTHTQKSTPLWFKEQGQKMWKSGKGFGKVGALYAGTECVIESGKCVNHGMLTMQCYVPAADQYRAKNDMTNAVAAGFVSGGILARSSGPKAAFGGAVAFAAFSAAIDLFLRRETADFSGLPHVTGFYPAQGELYADLVVAITAFPRKGRMTDVSDGHLVAPFIPTFVMHELTIGLTEPTIFLRRSGDVTASGRRRQESSDAPPAVLRGVLTLKLTNPMKIKDIKVFLEGKCVTEWPEGIGPRHNQFEDEVQLLTANATVFTAKQRAEEAKRRTRSLGPGVLLSYDSPDSDDEGEARGRTRHSSHGPSAASTSSSRSTTPDRHVRRVRGISMDQWGRYGYPAVEESAQLQYVPSPSYTPEELPEQPSQALEVLRNALKATTSHFIPVPGQLFADGTRSGSSTRPNTSTSRSRPGSMQRPPPPHVDLSPTPSRLDSRIDEQAEESSSASRTSAAAASSPRHSTTLGLAELTPPVSPHLPLGDQPVKKPKRFSFSAAWLDVKASVRRPSITNKDERPKLQPLTASRPPKSPAARPASISGPREPSRGRAPTQLEPNEARVLSPPRESSRGSSRATSRGRERTVAGKLGGVLGLEDLEDWEELRKGTYNWPVSFTIPADTPPSLRCDYGSVKYRLCAVVNRPGAFHGKITASAEVNVIACPGEDDTEENESIVVEREWESQLRYLIALSGKSFPLGGTMPLHITLVPMSKMSLYRINVAIEEKVSYFAQGRGDSRHEPIRRQVLLSLRHPDKSSPLLPIFSNSVDAATSSVLAPYVEAESASEVAEHLLTLTGPWAFHFPLKVPDCTTKIHFTNKYSNAKISVSHVIKITLRVDRGESDVDARGKRKQFDIIVECPVQLLSCRCNSEWINLPTYSAFALDPQQQAQMCVCRANAIRKAGQDDHRDMNADRHLSCGGLSPARPSLINAPPTLPIDNVEVAERNQQFARLVAGAESAAGETPPSYETATTEGYGYYI